MFTSLARRAALQFAVHQPRRIRDQRGQGLVEYALIVGLVAVVVIGVMATVGSQVNNVFSNVSNGLGQ